jgi:hypothetical protein
MRDDAAIKDSTAALATTVGLLEASGVNNPTLIGVLIAVLAVRLEHESVAGQVALRRLVVEKFS